MCHLDRAKQVGRDEMREECFVGAWLRLMCFVVRCWELPERDAFISWNRVESRALERRVVVEEKRVYLALLVVQTVRT